MKAQNEKIAQAVRRQIDCWREERSAQLGLGDADDMVRAILRALQPRTSGNLVHEVLTNPATSRWLHETLSSALNRDPVDAIADAERLLEILDLRLAEVQERHRAPR